MDKELKALENIASKGNAVKRFKHAVSCLHNEHAKLFRNLKTSEVVLMPDIRQAVLERKEGCMIWKLRNRPSKPEGHSSNQQTTTGIVDIYVNSYLGGLK